MQTFAKNPALLVMDVQKGFDEPQWGRRNNPQMETRIGELLLAWRSSQLPVIHVQHMSTHPDSPLRQGLPGNDFKDCAQPRDGETIIRKSVNSGFIGTSLDDLLRRQGYSCLVVVGMTTNHCISTTARMAGNLGFDAWVVADATATFDRTGPDGIVYPAELIHAIALSDLHGEFANVADSATKLAAMETFVSPLAACAVHP